MPDFEIEQGYDGVVAGIDEAGRGPLAGPVVAAAVVIDRRCFDAALLERLGDSKVMSAADREACYRALRRCARIGVGAASVREIDEINILQATLLAMRRAVAALPIMPDIALIDGNIAPKLPCKARTVIKGDALSFSIAAASVVAKVTRDLIMANLARRHLGYGWETNVGYGTPAHGRALLSLGVTPHHRRSFAPVRVAMQGGRLELPAI